MEENTNALETTLRNKSRELRDRAHHLETLADKIHGLHPDLATQILTAARLGDLNPTTRKYESP